MGRVEDVGFEFGLDAGVDVQAEGEIGTGGGSEGTIAEVEIHHEMAADGGERAEELFRNGRRGVELPLAELRSIGGAVQEFLEVGVLGGVSGLFHGRRLMV